MVASCVAASESWIAEKKHARGRRVCKWCVVRCRFGKLDHSEKESSTYAIKLIIRGQKGERNGTRAQAVWAVHTSCAAGVILTGGRGGFSFRASALRSSPRRAMHNRHSERKQTNNEKARESSD